MALETLDQSGFLFTETAGAWAMLTADFGEGYELAALVGHPDGLRSWSIKIDALPDSTDQGAPAIAIGGPPVYLTSETGDYLTTETGDRLISEAPGPGGSAITRAQYLWSFFQASKNAGNQPFWIEFDDPQDGQRKKFLASFIDHQISYAVLCAKVYGTGLQLKQRRVLGVDSPIAAV